MGAALVVLATLAVSIVGMQSAPAVAPALHLCNAQAWQETLTIAPGDSVTVVVDAPPSGEQCISYTQVSRTTDIANNFSIAIPSGGTSWPWVSGSAVLPGTYVFTADADAVNTNYRIVTANNSVSQTIIINVASPVPGPTGKPTAVAGVNKATVSWSLPSVNPSAVAYTEVYTYVDGDYDELMCTANAPATSCTTDWLPGGAPVQFVTYTYNANDDYDVMSAPSDPVTPTGDSTPPFGFCDMNSYQQSVNITLEQSVTLVVASYPAEPATGYCDNTTYGNISTAGGWAAIASYFDIATTPTGLVWPTAVNEPVPVGTYVLTPKSGAVPDRFQISTVNNTGGSSPNQVLGINVKRAVPGKTGKPTAIAGNGQATVSWTVPAVNPFAVAYTEVYTYVDGSYDELVCTVNAPATSCLVTGLTNGVPVQFVTYAYNLADDDGPESDPSDAVTPGVQPPNPAPNPAPVNGGGTSSESPAPAPTPSQTSAAPPRRPTLDPVVNQQNANVPSAGMPPGGSLLLVNGVPAAVAITPNAASSPNGLVVSGPGFTMRLAGLNAQGKPLALSSDGGALVLEQDRTAQVEGTGFLPSSEVRLFLFSTPRYIGSVSTDASGNFSGTVPIPTDIPPGRHTLQANGYSPSTQVRSMSIGVIVKEDRAPKVRVAQATVSFSALSSQLSDVAKAQLKALLKGREGTARRTAVIGYVQPTGLTANDETLSTARARAVKAYLRSLGLKGPVTARGDGIAKETGAAGRKVVVSIRYTK